MRYETHVLANGAIIKHACLMLLYLLIVCPIEYCFFLYRKRLKKTWHYDVVSFLNISLLILFCMEASFISKPHYQDYIRDLNQFDNNNITLRNKQTHHSKTVTLILTIQCLQIIPILCNIITEGGTNSAIATKYNCTIINNRILNIVNYHKTIEILTRLIYGLKIVLITLILPYTVLSGIITIDFGTLESNKRLDFMSGYWAQTIVHIVPTVPFYCIGIYYIWYHEYNCNYNGININKRLNWWKKLCLFESILILLLSLLLMMYFTKNNSIFDLFFLNISPKSWNEDKWNDILMGSPFVICSSFSLIFQLLSYNKRNNTKNNINSINSNNNSNDNMATVNLCNFHNLLIGISIILYGYAIYYHLSLPTNERLHEIAGIFAAIFGLFKVFTTLPITFQIIFNFEHFFQNIEQFWMLIMTLMLFCHFFILSFANPIMTS